MDMDKFNQPIDCHEVEEAEHKPKNPDINRLFKACTKMGASDLHLKANQPPAFRLKGDVRKSQEPALTTEDIERMIFEVLTESQKKFFLENGAIDFAHQVPGQDRFRVNAFRQRGMTSVAARRVVKDIRDFDQLHVPPALREISKLHQGLILLAGITGSGKSTTIAAMINHINQNRACHIVTIEDPIEYIFTDDKAFINQREVGIDVKNFQDALKYLMREDPDVVLVGEMRDRETFEAAIHAAETGHLCLGTIHASSSAQTLTRILDLFPEEERAQVRQSMVFNLKAVICQKLLPSIHPERPRVPCCEIMISNAIIRKLIQEGRDFEITAVLKASTAEGMQDFTEAIYRLVEEEYLDLKVALEVAPNPDELKMRLKGIKQKTGGILS
ncbi:MAG TPA: PilT/PilU family type 4a pilus ATPase [Phycisphaerae bacterium]|nr:PilT/PilU family type 4a pilus ATPase [Phycisphaerae bacterium]